MRRTCIVGAAMLGLYASSAWSQSSVTLYGLIDEAIRYDNHQTRDGGHNITMGAGGAILGSRWGLRGIEDLGGGTKALFTLESGFIANTGAMAFPTPGGQTREFGRQAFVGLSKQGWGTLTLGRQYLLAYLMGASHDTFAFANYAATWGFQAAGLVGGARLDNTVQYSSESYHGFRVNGAYTFGGVAGDTHRNSSPAVSVAYDAGALSVGAVYQIVNNIGGAVPANTAYGNTYFGIGIPDSTQKLFMLGASWTISQATLYAQYIYSHVYPADYRNDSMSLGASYRFNPAWEIRNAVYVDVLHHASGEGTRITTGPILFYHLSKRTDLYTGFNYNHLSGQWTQLASTAGFTQSFNGSNSLFEGVLGMIHRF
ncbi:gram-negative porin family protein [Paraburkholderia xenovorans LB400]|uniref:Outer membrane porin, OmpC family n=2 Tax=Paraburkholderia xenovorans TaxID=36873 RepID=Q13PF0_PARXL|nr:porin [Paraburkholderia xenovorans]ABE34039.1 outer membrane porin, OmpC family [Paraburkholderia xenovorans LB400]AIP37832.1 gram-negative porin family protein [Paraburkholderia xenovorans LB400]NPT37748.1 porin [Paraburkholderia xenovorans]